VGVRNERARRPKRNSPVIVDFVAPFARTPRVRLTIRSRIMYNGHSFQHPRFGAQVARSSGCMWTNPRVFLGKFFEFERFRMPPRFDLFHLNGPSRRRSSLVILRSPPSFPAFVDVSFSPSSISRCDHPRTGIRFENKNRHLPIPLSIPSAEPNDGSAIIYIYIYQRRWCP